MKKLKLEFWYKIFRIGDLLYTFGLKKMGLNAIDEGMYNLELLIWDDKVLRQYAKKRRMIR